MTERYYIGNARLIDGSGQAVPPEPYALLVEGRMIAAVAPQRELACPPDSRLIDARGMTVSWPIKNHSGRENKPPG